jgi:exopolysaccharide biosynthesis protein
VIGSSSRTTIDKLAKNLRKAGIYEAMNLDGGAGSAVYANGKITVNPDRKLSNIILINKKQ